VRPEKKAKRSYTKRVSDSLYMVELRRNPSRSARADVRYAPRTVHDGRRRTLGEKTCTDNLQSPSKESAGGRMFIKFNPGFTKLKSPGDLNNNDDGDDDDDMRVYDENDEEDLDFELVDKYRRPRKRHSARVFSEVNDEDLKMVAVSSSEKQYDQVHGTSCHQCRQKTLDTKTICRSEDCSGIRGMFCGPCLRNRYGEDAVQALKDKAWTCPPCRGTCNCSICRRRSGKACTGILVHHARERGFNDVDAYLSQAERNELNGCSD